LYFLAVRQLFSRPRQTLLAIVGIGLGTTAFLAISGMMLGFREVFIQQLINSTAHVAITPHEDPVTEHSLDSFFFPGSLVEWIAPPVAKDESLHLDHPQGWFDRLEKDQQVEAYAPQFSAQVLISRTKVSRPINIVGVEASSQVRTTDIQEDMVEGDFKDLERGGFQIILGRSLGEKIGVRRQGTVNLIDSAGASRPVKVAGFYETGITDIDETVAYAPLHQVQQVNRTPGRVSKIVVRLKDVSKARATADAWGLLGRDKVQSWDQANASFMTVFKFQDIMRFTLSWIIVIVAAFGVYNILNMIVLQKRGEIAILRSMGFDKGDITMLFFLQGLFLGTVGGLLGLGLGTLLCLYLESIRFEGMGQTTIDHILISWRFSTYAIGFTLAFVSGVMAGLFPARAASRMTPIDILRSEGN